MSAPLTACELLIALALDFDAVQVEMAPAEAASFVEWERGRPEPGQLSLDDLAAGGPS